MKNNPGLSSSEKLVKRTFDFMVSFIGLVLGGWLIVIGWFLARRSTGMSGFFMQERVGQYGRIFKVIKLRTMKPIEGYSTNVTSSHDPRITKVGNFLRKTKLDELPQLINVLLGQMSFVGPRPDVPGFVDRLEGEEKILLTIRPGITGPATLYFRNEEELLAKQEDPERYNRDVICPKKVALNMDYIKNYSFIGDVKYIFKTVLNV